MFIVFGLVKGGTAEAAATPYFAAGPVGFLMAVAVMRFTCNGASNVINLSADTENPKRNIPLGVLLSGGEMQRLMLARALYKNAPILLLDDLFDKLDMGRVEQLIKLVSGEEFGQIVITDCNKVRLETILGRQGGDYRLYVVANGEIAK